MSNAQRGRKASATAAASTRTRGRLRAWALKGNADALDSSLIPKVARTRSPGARDAHAPGTHRPAVVRARPADRAATAALRGEPQFLMAEVGQFKMAEDNHRPSRARPCVRAMATPVPGLSPRTSAEPRTWPRRRHASPRSGPLAVVLGLAPEAGALRRHGQVTRPSPPCLVSGTARFPRNVFRLRGSPYRPDASPDD